MSKFYASIALCLLMGLAAPYTDLLAVSETSPWYTHYLYIIGHNGFLHFLINAWTLLVLHNLLRWYRVVAAYLWAVFISYILLPDIPMVGLSVFNCFFIGFATPWMWRRDRLTVFLTLGLLLLTCVVSGFAGLQHVTSYSFGFLFCLSEWKIREILEYLKE